MNLDITVSVQDIDFIEHFSGAEVLTSETQSAGYAVASLDVLHSPRGMDVLEPSGYGRLGLTIMSCYA